MEYFKFLRNAFKILKSNQTYYIIDVLDALYYIGMKDPSPIPNVTHSLDVQDGVIGCMGSFGLILPLYAHAFTMPFKKIEVRNFEKLTIF